MSLLIGIEIFEIGKDFGKLKCRKIWAM